MKQERGFTVVELLVVLAALLLAGGLFVAQKSTVDATIRDNSRKTSINAMYYNLEEVFYEQNGYYPQSIDSATLRAMDPELLRDPNGLIVGEPASTLQYDAAMCSLDGECQRYTLRADLEREAEYTKNSRRS